MGGVAIDALRQVPLFAELNDEELERVADVFKQRRFPKGETVIQQGSGAAAFFVIDSGEATVLVDGREQRTMKAGRPLRRDGADRRRHAYGDGRRRHRPGLLGRHVLGLPAARRGERRDRLEALQSLIGIYRSERFGADEQEPPHPLSRNAGPAPPRALAPDALPVAARPGLRLLALLVCGMLDERYDPACHEPRGSHGLAGARHLHHLDDTPRVAHLHAPARAGGGDLIRPRAVVGGHDDLNAIALHGESLAEARSPAAALSRASRLISSAAAGGRRRCDSHPALESGSCVRLHACAIALKRASRPDDPPRGKESLRANPPRGGDAKPGISRRPPSCRPQDRSRLREKTRRSLTCTRSAPEGSAERSSLCSLARPWPVRSPPWRRRCVREEPEGNPFAPLGDNSSYVLLAGGSFESGAPGWSLNNAEVVDEGPAAVGASHALLIGSGGSAVSPQFCVSSEYPVVQLLRPSAFRRDVRPAQRGHPLDRFGRLGPRSTRGIGAGARGVGARPRYAAGEQAPAVDARRDAERAPGVPLELRRRVGDQRRLHRSIQPAMSTREDIVTEGARAASVSPENRADARRRRWLGERRRAAARGVLAGARRARGPSRARCRVGGGGALPHDRGAARAERVRLQSHRRRAGAHAGGALRGRLAARGVPTRRRLRRPLLPRAGADARPASAGRSTAARRLRSRARGRCTSGRQAQPPGAHPVLRLRRVAQPRSCRRPVGGGRSRGLGRRRPRPRVPRRLSRRPGFGDAARVGDPRRGPARAGARGGPGLARRRVHRAARTDRRPRRAAAARRPAPGAPSRGVDVRVVPRPQSTHRAGAGPP